MALFTGILVDSYSKPLGGAEIIFTALETSGEVLVGQVSKYPTDGEGRYVFEVPIGFYNVQVQQKGEDAISRGKLRVYGNSTSGDLNDFLTRPILEPAPAWFERIQEERFGAEMAAKDARTEAAKGEIHIAEARHQANKSTDERIKSEAAAAKSLNESLIAQESKAESIKQAELATIARRIAEDESRISSEKSVISTEQAEISTASKLAAEKAQGISETKASEASTSANTATTQATKSENEANRSEAASTISIEHAGKLEGIATELVKTQNLIATLHPLY